MTTQQVQNRGATEQEKIQGLGRGESFDVDIRDRSGKRIEGGATVTLCGPDGSYGGYIQVKGSGRSFFYSGTNAAGQHVDVHSIDRDGRVSKSVNGCPDLDIQDRAQLEKMFGLENGNRRGFQGSYSIQNESNGSLSVFYSGERHSDGTRLGAQTFVEGRWNRSYAHSRPKKDERPNPTSLDPNGSTPTPTSLSDATGPSAGEAAERVAQLRAQRAANEARNNQQSDKQDLLTNSVAIGHIAIVEVGEMGPDNSQTTVSFQLVDRDGKAKIEDTAVGDQIHLNCLTVTFENSLLESGQVSEHPTRILGFHGSAEAPDTERPVLPVPQTADSPRTNSDAAQAFLERWSASPDGEKPSWDTFWKFTGNASSLSQYEADRAGFWQEFWEQGNQETYSQLANDPELQKVLGIQGVSPAVVSIGVKDGEGRTVAPGSVFEISRRGDGDFNLALVPKTTDTD